MRWACAHPPPGLQGRASLPLDLWLGYVVGKPTERVEVQSSVTLHGGVTKEQLKAMTTAELEAIAEGRMPWPLNGAGKRLELEAGESPAPEDDAE